MEESIKGKKNIYIFVEKFEDNHFKKVLLELEKKFDKLEPKEMPKSANLINTAKQHLSRVSWLPYDINLRVLKMKKNLFFRAVDLR